MGKLEKYVVLTVLFVVAVILGVSLNSPDGVAAAEGAEHLAAAERGAPVRTAPLAVEPRRGSAPSAPTSQPSGDELEARAERERQRREARQAAEALRRASPSEDPAPPAANQPLGPAGVLSTARPESSRRSAERSASSLRPDSSLRSGSSPRSEPSSDARIESAPRSASVALPAAGAFLLTEVGLVPSLSDEFMIYTWQQGDSFLALSERYFGSKLHVNRLLSNNEGLDDGDLRAGDQILVPVRAAAAAEKAAPGTTPSGVASTYTVRSGDVLGTISQAVYGTSQSWRKIFDANRDLLADPNRLEVGMVLRIPE